MSDFPPQGTVSHRTIVVGVPVYNEARYLRATLDALTAQTYRDFAIFIADNASDDGTSQICEEFAARDPRISYVRHAQNMGSADNFAFVRDRSDSPYFMWLGGHDLIAENYLETQLAVLERDPGIALAYSRAIYIEDDGRVLSECCEPFLVYDDTDGLTRYLRSLKERWGDACVAVNGVFRRAVIAQMPCYQFAGPDEYILIRTQFFGRIVRIVDTAYTRRMFSTRNTTYMERITGKATRRQTPYRNMYPLFFALVRNFAALPVSFPRKIRHFPLLVSRFHVRYRPLKHAANRALPYGLRNALRSLRSLAKA